MRFIAVAAALAAAVGVTVNVTDVTMLTRACQPPLDTFPFCDTTLSIDERVQDLIYRIKLEDIPPQITARHGEPGQWYSPLSNISYLGIPEYDWGLNSAHGVQSSCVQDQTTGAIYCPTSFPNPLSYAAIWNASEVQDMAAVIATEARALWLAGATEENGSPPPHIGLDAWSPVINIVADPRWGRNVECIGGESILLTADGGTAFTRGLQVGEDPRYLKTAVTLKHWVAYQLEDSDGSTRYNFNAQVSNFTLIDSYMRPFEAAVREANAAGVMCSYNAIVEQANSSVATPTCASAFLAHVLRNVWGFDGYVTSDSGSIENFANHGYTNTSEEAACAALQDGQTDVCSGYIYQNFMLNATASGLCNMSVVYRALEHTMRLRMRMGLFDAGNASAVAAQPYWNVPLSAVNTTASQALSLSSAKGSMVLLKHDGVTLPLPVGRNIAIVGPHSNALYSLLGNYIGQICPSQTGVSENLNCVTPLNTAIADLNIGGKTVSVQGCPTVECNTTAGFQAAVDAAQAADIVILALGIDGTVEGEMRDRVNLTLPGFQQELSDAITALKKPTAMVLINAGPIDISAQAANPVIGAIVSAGYPGVQGAKAIAATLFGQNERCCGKLQYTVYPQNYTSQILMNVTDLDTGVGKGYRYYAGPTVYPFGYGLALANFTLAAASVPNTAPVFATETTPSLNATYTFTVTNVGAVVGDTVVQVYMAPVHPLPSQPASRLIKELIAYQRVHLGAGASTTVSFTVNSASLRMVDKATGDVVSTPGAFNLLVTDGVLPSPLTFPVTVAGAQLVVAPFPAP